MRRKGPKQGLYSVSYAGLWYEGPALSIKEFVDRAVRFGYEGVELDCRAPHALPYALKPAERREIAQYIQDSGLQLAALACNNDFSSPVTEHRDANIQMVAEMIRLARDLGAPVVRVFTAWGGSAFREGVGTYEISRPAMTMAFPQTTEYEKWQFCLDAFRIVAKIAEEENVILALQNHPPVVRNGRDCLNMANTVGSPNFKLSYDISGERLWQSTEWVTETARMIGDNWVHSHWGGDFERDKDGKVVRIPMGRDTNPMGGGLALNDDAWVNAMFDNGFDGYVTYEACTACWQPNGHYQTLEQMDERVKLAREYMEQLFDKHGARGEAVHNG